MLDSYMGNSAIYEPLRTRVVAERAEQVQQLVAALQERGLHAEGKARVGPSAGRSSGERGPFAKRRSGHHRTRFGGAGLTQNEWRLVSTCPAPVLVVKAPAHTRTGISSRPSILFTRTRSRASSILRFLAHAHDLRTRTRATLSALHCYVPFEYFGADLATPPAISPKRTCDAKQSKSCYENRVCRPRLRGSRPDRRTR